MDPAKFYGKRRAIQVRYIPDESDDSELSDEEDYDDQDDDMWLPSEELNHGSNGCE